MSSPDRMVEDVLDIEGYAGRVRAARRVAHDTITSTVRECAYLELGLAGTETAEAAQARRRSMQDPLIRAAVELRCVQIAHDLGLSLQTWLVGARTAHVSWTELAAALDLDEDQVLAQHPQVDPDVHRLTGAPATPAPLRH